MKRLGIVERFLLPNYGNVKQIAWARITVDTARCTGCGLCVRACPADSIMMAGKKACMKPHSGDLLGDPGISQCMGCGDCAALCPSGAITLSEPYRWTRFFRTIDRGELAPPRL